jgi:hypothetical protein
MASSALLSLRRAPWLEAKAGLEAYAQKMDRAYEKRYGRRPDVD